MTKIDDFAGRVLIAVAYDMDITPEMITDRCRCAEAVDARHVVAMILYRSGIYVSRIAGILRVSPRYVQYIITEFEGRMQSNRPLRMTYERVLARFTPGPV